MGARIDIFETLDSTSLEAKRRAAAGEVGPLWLIALMQTSGYGRRGSEWHQQAGDIAATFLFHPPAPADALPQLSFIAALSVSEAIMRFAPKAALTLKWPNDVLAGGGKIAGLLLELVSPAPALIAMGVGVNIVSAPSGLDYPTARLIDFTDGAPPAPRVFVETLDEVFAVWCRRWEQKGFGPVRAEWLARADGLGQSIKVRLPGEVVEGVLRDLDCSGAMILDCGGMRRTISAGAVLAPAR